MRCILLLSCALLALGQAPGQPTVSAPRQPSAQAPEQGEVEAVFRTDTKLVELHATVVGKDGKLVTGLPQSAFKIFENDVEQEIKVFRQEDAPVSLGLVIDNSASMKEKRARVSAAALTLVRESNPGDEEFIINFSENPLLIQEFTSDIATLETALNRINPRGETALRDAVSVGLEHLKRSAKNDKKVLLVVSDGEDNSSMTVLKRLTADAQKAGILIYTIGLLSEASERETARARQDLDTLSNATGGEAFYPTDLAEVDSIAKHVAHDLRNQYTLAYNPSDARQDGSFRRLHVTVNQPEGATVRTRTGYFSSGSTAAR